eukprot:TRINITY_DN129157_c0_g1_i1.p1 TRINITY_DN129157_c0_g1~~TRINITY_DN129157_c0_g1_i1.p1  ORF type:complete len:362 (+),score=12.73 TRINITY_DN129157_c0_g1_i1:56-1087(+)
MLENSSITSFYGKKLGNIDIDKELKNIKKNYLFGDFDNADIVVIGAGVVEKEKQNRDHEDMSMLKKFWDEFFKKSNANLKVFADPELVTPLSEMYQEKKMSSIKKFLGLELKKVRGVARDIKSENAVAINTHRQTQFKLDENYIDLRINGEEGLYIDEGDELVVFGAYQKRVFKADYYQNLTKKTDNLMSNTKTGIMLTISYPIAGFSLLFSLGILLSMLIDGFYDGLVFVFMLFLALIGLAATVFVVHYQHARTANNLRERDYDQVSRYINQTKKSFQMKGEFQRSSFLQTAVSYLQMMVIGIILQMMIQKAINYVTRSDVCIALEKSFIFFGVVCDIYTTI